MKILLASLLAVVVIGGVALTLLASELRETESRERALELEVARLAERLASLEEEQGRLAGSARELDERLASLQAAPPPIIQEGEIERVLERWLERHAAAAPAGREHEAAEAAETPPGAAPAGGGRIELDEALGQLFDPRTPYADKQLVWLRVKDAGLLDQVIAAFEERVRREPHNPDFQTQAGNAYLQKVTLGASDQEKGLLAMKADRAFDAALAVDPGHWEARFSKAMALAFWPPIFGKQAESIRQFETLLEQQESQVAPRAEFVQTYLFLGNLYEQQGSREKALETWRKGGSRFPDHPELSRRLVEAAE
jgi:tetratricopeptide (TPR) repeat protein